MFFENKNIRITKEDDDVIKFYVKIIKINKLWRDFSLQCSVRILIFLAIDAIKI